MNAKDTQLPLGRPKTDGWLPRPALVIRDLAAAQHGVVSRAQLRGAGVPPHIVAYRVRTGELLCVHRGVYQVGPLKATWAREMAATLACGDAAALGHMSAARLIGLASGGDTDSAQTDVDVLLEGYDRGRQQGIRVHRTRCLGADEVTRIEGIPVTTPARTLLDLAATTDPRQLERALARAERERLITRGELQALLARHPRHRGAGALRTLLGGGGTTLTRSAAEERFLGLVRRGGLRSPATNVQLLGFEVDCFWPAERVVVEIDGFEYHSSRPAFERDRRRDRVLTSAGLRVLRVTWKALVDEPERVLIDLARVLERDGGHG